METFVFIAGAFICLLGALGVITSENPVHSALSLVGMLIGVDRSDDIQVEPLTGQRVAAAVVGLVLAVGLVAVVTLGSVTGAPASPDPVVSSEPNTEAIGRVLFTDHLLAFEITSVLLVIAVVGAVALARHRGAALLDDEHPGDAVPELASDDAVAGEVAS